MQVVEREVQVPELVEIPNGVRDVSDEVAGAEPEDLEVGEFSELGGDWTGEKRVVREVECFEGGDVGEGRGDGGVEEVVDEGENLEILERSEGVWDGAGEVVGGEVEVAEVREEG